MLINEGHLKKPDKFFTEAISEQFYLQPDISKHTPP